MNDKSDNKLSSLCVFKQQHNYNIDQVMLNIPETAISEEPCLEALCQAQLVKLNYISLFGCLFLKIFFEYPLFLNLSWKKYIEKWFGHQFV